MIKLTCSICGLRHSVDHDLAGKEIPCECGALMPVPFEFSEAKAIVRRVEAAEEDAPLVSVRANSAPSKPGDSTLAVAIISGLVVLCGVWFLVAPRKYVAKPAIVSGDTVFVRNIGGREVGVAANLDALNRMHDVLRVGDAFGARAMIARGEVFFCEPGVKLLILSRGIEQHEVRVLSGQHMGRAGWIDVAEVVK